MTCAPALQHTVTAPCAPLRLDPIDGNIHSFEALEHTAIFDILAPPYSDRDGRSCHYYEVAADGEAIELREVPWPDSLVVVNRPYSGEAVSARVARNE